MKIRTIQVQAGRTMDLPTGHRGTMRPFLTLTADLEKGDNVEEKVGELQALAENLLEEHIEELKPFLVARAQRKNRTSLPGKKPPPISAQVDDQGNVTSISST